MDGWKMSFLLGNPIFRCELLVLGDGNPFFLRIVTIGYVYVSSDPNKDLVSSLC